MKIYQVNIQTRPNLVCMVSYITWEDEFMDWSFFHSDDWPNNSKNTWVRGPYNSFRIL